MPIFFRTLFGKLFWKMVKIDHTKIGTAYLDSLCWEFSNRCLGIVVCSPFGFFGSIFFVCFLWGSNPDVVVRARVTSTSTWVQIYHQCKCAVSSISCLGSWSWCSLLNGNYCIAFAFSFTYFTAGLPISCTLGRCHNFYCWGLISNRGPVLDSSAQTVQGMLLDFL